MTIPVKVVKSVNYPGILQILFKQLDNTFKEEPVIKVIVPLHPFFLGRKGYMDLKKDDIQHNGN